MELALSKREGTAESWLLMKWREGFGCDQAEFLLFSIYVLCKDQNHSL